MANVSCIRAAKNQVFGQVFASFPSMLFAPTQTLTKKWRAPTPHINSGWLTPTGTITKSTN